MKRLREWIRSSEIVRPCGKLFIVLFVAAQVWGPATEAVAADEAYWIWSPKQEQGAVPTGACYFRRDFSTTDPERARILIAADDQYELFVNGRRVGSGTSDRQLDRYDVQQYVQAGTNTIAIKVANQRGPTAALVARVLIKERSGPWVSHSTDKSWRTNLRPLPLWYTPLYNDHFWDAAQPLRQLESVAPEEPAEEEASEEEASGPADPSQQFRVGQEFEVQRVLDHDQTGSLIAMAFNEFGQVVASRESGPLLLIHDSDEDEIVDTVQEYCDQVENVQGILPLNGQVYVTAEGPEGNGFYLLTDTDRDGQLETVELLFKFEGQVGEYGAHGITLGPDGWIYVVIGNQTRPLPEYDEQSPYGDSYEGDLLSPRYEDPRGHSAGRKAPGGCIIRTDPQGETVQIVAGGLRNAYDLAFNSSGDLFVHDSDMKSDLGTTWYRPTRLYAVVPSAEFGWRSGWAKWPEYYVDCLPAIASTDRAAPTGAVFYDHFRFPRRLQNMLFLADWSAGRILAVSCDRDGAGFAAKTELFLEGPSLRITDLDVGPDGWLYLVTGGRGAPGGLYRVTWKGNVPAAYEDLGTGIAPAIRQPQLQSAWARQEIARVKSKIGEDWGPMLLGVVRSPANSSDYRLRALDLMRLYGPHPASPLLVELSRDRSELIRMRAASLMGTFADDQTHEQLLRLLEDPDRMVRRKACEALVAADQAAPVDNLLPLLASEDRMESWAARKVLESMPSHQWREPTLSTSNHPIFVQGALALLTAEPNEANALFVLERIRTLMDGFVSDRDFVKLIRVAQVAIDRGRLVPQQLTALRDQLAIEFPAADPIMNRELVRLLVFLQAGSIIDRYFKYLDSDIAKAEKVHVAMHLRFLQTGWTKERKLELLQLLTEATAWEDGSSYESYLNHAARDFARELSPAESIEVLQRGAEWPAAALGALYQVPPLLDDELRSVLQQLDQELDGRTDPASQRLMVGIVAVLARSGDAASMAYLRSVWDRSPARRKPVVMGLSQAPAGDNWPYLVQSLPDLDEGTAAEVLRRLTHVDQVPDDAEHFRQVVLTALRHGKPLAKPAIALLEHWSRTTQGEPTDSWDEQLTAWQAWFAETYPEYPEAVLSPDAVDREQETDPRTRHSRDTVVASRPDTAEQELVEAD